ncbi:hypothetical protein PV326_009590 [Microctonus aethiopoides]|nr:hypothetical protein PV326_009590 [Microctonus aethiopoides]
MEINLRLLDHLKLLNCDVESDNAAKQCEYLRKSYDLDEDEFAEKWVEYVVNTKDGGTNVDVTDAKIPGFEKWLKDNINLYEPREERTKKPTIVYPFIFF